MYHEIFNPVLKKKIRFNSKAYNDYLNIIKKEPNLIPYQSIDMYKKGTVKFADINDVKSYLEMRDRYNRIKIQTICPFDLASDIDIFKMKREVNKYHYLIQIDPDVISHHNDIKFIIDNYCHKTNVDDYIFVPYIPENEINNENFTIEKHNIYQNISIVNNEKFVEYLKTKIGKNVGQLIFKFNDLFRSYHSMHQDLENDIGINIDQSNIIDHIMDYQQKRIYGLNKKDIAKRLWKREEMIESLQRIKVDNCDINEKYSDYFHFLEQQNKILEDIDRYNEIIKCTSSDIFIDLLIEKKIQSLGPPNANNIDEYFKICTDIKYSPYEEFSLSMYENACHKIIRDIPDDVIRNNLLAFHHQSKIRKNSCIYPVLENYVPNIKLFPELMPEWYEQVYQNNIQEAFKHRQLILGERDTTIFFRKCSLLVMADPFISKNCNIPGLMYDLEWNKILISCIADKDDIFPIRIVNGRRIENLNLYEYFDKTNDDKLIGSIIIRLVGRRTQMKPRFYVLYIYYNPTIRNILRPVDFRANIVIPGTIVEHVRALYLELNTLMYYHLDIGKKLHFYRNDYDNTFDIYVSKYNLSEIKRKYQNSPYLSKKVNILDRLKEVFITKDPNKNFRFVEYKGQTGGNASKNVGLYFECTDWEWDIKTSEIAKTIDKEVYSLSAHLILYKSLEYYTRIMGKYIYSKECIIHNLYSIHDYKRFFKFSKELYSKEVEPNVKYLKSRGKIYDTISKFIEKMDEKVLAYPFAFSISWLTYICLDEYGLIRENDNIIIFARNHYMLDGILYYIKFRRMISQSVSMNYNIYTYKTEIHEFVLNYLKGSGIKWNIIDFPLDNKNIEKYLSEHPEDINLGVIDLLIKIEELEEFRNSYSFQTILSALICIFKKLRKGGTILINTSAITSKLVINFMIYLACHFQKVFVYEPEDREMRVSGAVVFSLVVFLDYKGGIDIDKLMEINDILYKFDPDGGLNYQITDIEEIRTLKIKYQSPNPPKKYLTSIIKIKNGEHMYKKHKKYIRDKLLDVLAYYTMRYQLYKNKENKSYLREYCKFSKLQAIYFAKKYHLPLLQWIELEPVKYFNKMIIEELRDIGFTKYFLFNTKSKIDTLKLFENLKTEDKISRLRKIFELSELAYQYIEKINYDQYKKIELFINHENKKLNSQLFHEYQVNINGKEVSRAWIKMFELLFDLHFFDNFKNDTIKGFHICEAPGNFINAITYYTKKMTNIRNYLWRAQSLASFLADFYDTYGFIKSTNQNWDLGPNGTGDIISIDNLQYYYDKYHDYDILVGDCGEKWSPDESISRNLPIYQLIYALIIPKVGGNFIIKSFATNYYGIFLSLLYVACGIYEKIYAFKSNSNFWSPEVYFVGINKIKNVDHIKIINIAENLANGKIKYPIEELPDDFIVEYENIMYQYVTSYTNIKKFFVFLSTNYNIFNAEKDNIAKIIHDKNTEWIKRYIERI